MSNMDKRPFLKKYISDSLNKTAEIKNIIHSLEDFENAVKIIKSATFIQMRNIMNTAPNSIFARTANIFGLDAPERLYLKADCGGSPIENVKQMLRSFKNKRHNGEFDNIIIVGEDDAGVEHSFDFSSIIQSVGISPSKNENGHYNSDDVQNLLLIEIR